MKKGTKVPFFMAVFIINSCDAKHSLQDSTHADMEMAVILF